jgi:squalene-hopene/tetraprenyl-beta-curcumene cyclase
MKSKWVIAFLLLLTLCMTQLGISQKKSEPGSRTISTQVRKDMETAIERGVKYLLQNQKANGCWEDHVGITALAVTAILKQTGGAHKQAPEVKKGLDFIAGLAKPDGGIYGEGTENYSTAVSIMALLASGNPAFKPLISKGQQYMKGVQITGDPNDKNYGGIGYSSKGRADLPNLEYALEALKASGLAEDDPVWQRAIQFVQRVQNRTESNDQSYSLNDGGFTYGAGMGWQNTGQNSYGSMTYSGILSYIYANLKKGDPRVESAMNWIRQHYTLEENPGVGQKAVYYYYMVFGKALQAYGDPVLVDAKGRRHNWREELGKKLLELQNPEGYWVNTEPAEWQTNKVLVTAFTIIALEHALM